FFAASDQFEPGFMDQRRSLQGLAGRLLGHFVRGQLSQFVINQRQQFIGSFGVALQNCIKNARDIAHALTVATSVPGGNSKAKIEKTANIWLKKPLPRGAKRATLLR